MSFNSLLGGDVNKADIVTKVTNMFKRVRTSITVIFQSSYGRK